MNCRKGDLAFIVTCPIQPESVGLLVQCVRFIGQEKLSPLNDPHNSTEFTDVWLIEYNGSTEWACRDAWLKPLRDPGQDETDEMLLIVKSPVKRTLETTK